MKDTRAYLLCDDYSVLQMAVNILGGKKRMDVISL
jgi:hypothetical protein